MATGTSDYWEQEPAEKTEQEFQVSCRTEYQIVSRANRSNADIAEFADVNVGRIGMLSQRLVLR